MILAIYPYLINQVIQVELNLNVGDYQEINDDKQSMFSKMIVTVSSVSNFNFGNLLTAKNSISLRIYLPINSITLILIGGQYQ
jgi:hypothetical protein